MASNDDRKWKGTVQELQDDRDAKIDEAVAEKLQQLLNQFVQLRSIVDQKINAVTHRQDINRIAQGINLLQEKVLEQEQKLQCESNRRAQEGPAVNEQDINTVITHHEKLGIKCLFFEDIIKTLRSEIERCSIAQRAIEKKYTSMQDKLDDRERRVVARRDVQDAVLSELDHRIKMLEATSYNGTLIWKIPEWSKLRRDAIAGNVTSIYSTHFFNRRTGYRMCAKLYPNGDGMGHNCYMSIYLAVVRGFYDALLSWPFAHPVTFMLLDQNNRDHVIDSFRPDPNSSSFQRPTTDMNIASGFPLFMPLSKLDDANTAYVKDDVMFIKVIVHPKNPKPNYIKE